MLVQRLLLLGASLSSRQWQPQLVKGLLSEQAIYFIADMASGCRAVQCIGTRMCFVQCAQVLGLQLGSA